MVASTLSGAVWASASCWRIALQGLGQVVLGLLAVAPVGQGHVHCYEVLEMHSQDGEAKARVLCDTQAVLPVLPTGGHKFHQVV